MGFLTKTTLQVQGRPQSTGSQAQGAKLDDNLNKHYFGPWRVLSEGWGDDLYLIDGDDKFHKIESKGHSNDVKELWAGRKLVDGEHYWFGPRLFPFDVEATSSASNLAAWKATIDLLKRQSRSELQHLSQFLQSKNDEEMCEIIDVLTSCRTLRHKLVDNGKLIKEGLTFKLEQIDDSLDKVKLEGPKPTEQEWKAFAELFSRAIEIKKLSVFQGLVATYGTDWMKEVNSSLLNGGGVEGEIRNPLQYLIKVASNDGFGFYCGSKERKYEKYFEECESKKNDERLKVSHVLKSSYSGGSAEGRRRVPRRGGGASWGEQNEVNGTLKSEIEKQYERKLVIEGLVDEHCKKFRGYWFMISPEADFCHEINKLFFGDKVDEKLGEFTISFSGASSFSDSFFPQFTDQNLS